MPMMILRRIVPQMLALDSTGTVCTSSADKLIDQQKAGGCVAGARLTLFAVRSGRNSETHERGNKATVAYERVFVRIPRAMLGCV